MKKHKHICIFKHIGGGCLMGNKKSKEKNPCDDHYRCEVCGIEFKIYCSREVHFALPGRIVGRKPK